MRTWPEPNQVEHLSDTSFLGKLLVFLANVRLDWKEIASYKHSSLFCLVISDGEKLFYKIDTRNFSSATWASVIKKTVPRFFSPAFWYKLARSAFKSGMP